MKKPEIIFYDTPTPAQQSAVDGFLDVAIEFRNQHAIFAALDGRIPDTETTVITPMCGQPDRIEALRESFADVVAQRVLQESYFDDDTEERISNDENTQILIKKLNLQLDNQEDIRLNIFRQRFSVFAGRVIAAEQMTIDNTDNDDGTLTEAG